jgi:3-isopropylmalate/(R)-2-methylmalate dehydratase large subunit
VIGADSHTTTAGAVGAFATGVGATDFLNVLTTGQIWLRVPKTIKVELVGTLHSFLQGKDIVLALLGQLGSDGANYKSLEFHDMTDDGISMDSRATICNMAVDLGAKFGLFVPDRITRDYIRQRGGEFRELHADADAEYESVQRIDLNRLEPLLSAPGGKVAPVRDFADVQVTQVFMGSCTAGRLEDLEAIAHILEGRKVHDGIKVIVIPGSQSVFGAALDRGYVKAIATAGATWGNASCGPCCNIDKGVVGDHEVSLSTSNRNYPGRMGSLLSKTYLASSLTAAATALNGRITDPREFL